MAVTEKKPVKIVETVLRDAHQSLIATRMSTEQMLPIIEKMDKIGYYAVECWGGATFDASLRFLKEDPWQRLRILRDGFKNTKLQMLFRGQNILLCRRNRNMSGNRIFMNLFPVWHRTSRLWREPEMNCLIMFLPMSTLRPMICLKRHQRSSRNFIRAM